ncbi:hypothetical protein T05_6266 [Trichinella murrelli]|uniref:Uncharacterized protein n=1 Tax=Trichinella murrelli TaxID=144512 RepID=A0A0V0U8F7_9BILA|nr:hypothetical protein T05_6266 [Trichinella murrelli]
MFGNQTTEASNVLPMRQTREVDCPHAIHVEAYIRLLILAEVYKSRAETRKRKNHILFCYVSKTISHDLTVITFWLACQKETRQTGRHQKSVRSLNGYITSHVQSWALRLAVSEIVVYSRSTCQVKQPSIA